MAVKGTSMGFARFCKGFGRIEEETVVRLRRQTDTADAAETRVSHST